MVINDFIVILKVAHIFNIVMISFASQLMIKVYLYYKLLRFISSIKIRCIF